MRTLAHSLKAWLAFTLITGLAFPLAVWIFGMLFYPQKANGSILRREGLPVGSLLLAQKTNGDRYIHPRPSAGDYATTPSAASNASWTDKSSRERLASFPPSAEDHSQSASGLDPDVTPESAIWQLQKVAKSRGWTEDSRRKAEEWVAANTHGGIISPAYVNVLQLNLAIDLIPAGK